MISIEKGGPQGSVVTPMLFITYNFDMDCFLPARTSHFFADGLAGTVAGQLGLNYTSQCLDLEKRMENILAQPINTNKTEALFSVRKIGSSKFDIHFNYGMRDQIKWAPEYKYLGYFISSKLGWGKFFEMYDDQSQT